MFKIYFKDFKNKFNILESNILKAFTNLNAKLAD
jgi:hypothetical protein